MLTVYLIVHIDIKTCLCKLGIRQQIFWYKSRFVLSLTSDDHFPSFGNIIVFANDAYQRSAYPVLNVISWVMRWKNPTALRCNPFQKQIYANFTKLYLEF